MPQLELVGSQASPYVIKFSYTEDPLAPTTPPLMGVYVYDAKHRWIDGGTVQLPPLFAVEAFADIVMKAMLAYENETAKKAVKVVRYHAAKWRKHAEEQSNNR